MLNHFCDFVEQRGGKSKHFEEDLELTGQRSNEFEGDLSSAIKYLDGVETRQPHNAFTPISIEVKDTEVLCLHLLDEKRRFRDVTLIWEDGDHRHDTFESKDDVYYTPYGFGAMEIEVSEARRRKKE